MAAAVAGALAEGDAAAVHPLLDVAAAAGGPDDDEEVQDEEEEGGEDDTIVHRSRSTRNAISGGEMLHAAHA